MTISLDASREHVQQSTDLSIWIGLSCNEFGLKQCTKICAGFCISKVVTENPNTIPLSNSAVVSPEDVCQVLKRFSACDYSQPSKVSAVPECSQSFGISTLQTRSHSYCVAILGDYRHQTARSYEVSQRVYKRVYVLLVHENSMRKDRIKGLLTKLQKCIFTRPMVEGHSTLDRERKRFESANCVGKHGLRGVNNRYVVSS